MSRKVTWSTCASTTRRNFRAMHRWRRSKTPPPRLPNSKCWRSSATRSSADSACRPRRCRPTTRLSRLANCRKPSRNRPWPTSCSLARRSPRPKARRQIRRRRPSRDIGNSPTPRRSCFNSLMAKASNSAPRASFSIPPWPRPRWKFPPKPPRFSLTLSTKSNSATSQRRTPWRARWPISSRALFG